MTEIEHTEGALHHVQPLQTYLKVFLALTGLMILTVAASFWQVSPIFNNLVALLIAGAKATLVVLFFMGVKFSTKLTKVWAVTGFIWLTLLGIIFADYFTRPVEEAPGWYQDSGSALREYTAPGLKTEKGINIRPRQ